MKHTPTRNLALTAIALLALTGCGAQATGSVPEPDSSSTTSTVASSSTSAVEETASTEETNYSGGSKAPEGEYRAADEHGPAQNVPKPVAPEGMNVESTEAMLLFINYWNDMRNYAIQTGDTQDLKRMYEDTYEADLRFIDSVDKLYKNNGWIIGLKRDIHANRELVTNLGNSAYSLGANITVENGVINEVHNIKGIDNSEANLNGYEIIVTFKDGEWKVSDGKVVK
ncbi:DUF6318 family protein [Rothia sp. SD9660Na]|uniref:DUF6318 family protein n=1 Tax=Rothia sp. SD9660Na TaxID=3047030 RepID=UPI0024BB6BD8|nr:DUF6318 family protein [Rothia sp. SD9660Na]WHS50618.1 DUF6318 family protein [Rothia sp. SD9660Na]